jgi:hypothetical protein
VDARKSALRQEFETGRRREAFFAFLAGGGIGIIAADTWISHWLGAPAGLLVGGAAYAIVYGYETLMWRRRHG